MPSLPRESAGPDKHKEAQALPMGKDPGLCRVVLATTDDVGSDVLADGLIPYNRWPLNKTKIRGPRGSAGRNTHDEMTHSLLVWPAPAKSTQDSCLGVTAHGAAFR